MNDLSAAGDVDISDVTSDSINADILRKLKNDDPKFTELQVCGSDDVRRDCYYAIEDARGMEVLGHYLGRCTYVTTLTFSLPEDLDSGIIEAFLFGLRSNRSIQKVLFLRGHIPSDFFLMLTPFIKSNPNMTQFNVKSCVMDADQYRSFSSVLREGKSLNEFYIGGLVRGGHYDHEESIISNIEALKMHPQLERIALYGFTMRRKICAALSDLLRQSDGVQTLFLMNDEIDDSGVEALVDGLAHCRGLKELHLSDNPAITVRGWRALAALLESSNSRLQELVLSNNPNAINDESTIIFANALAHNNTLTTLDLYSDVESTGEGWKTAFSRVLCDTSSVNSTFLSNHTLQHVLGPGMDENEYDLPDEVASLLTLNRVEDKKAVAFRKILMYHDDFDMQPLFEWDLKVLPFVIEWLERVAAYEIECEARTERRKISVIYQFIRGMPELAVEGITGVNKKSAQTVGEKRSYSAACE